jgi:hypothetical protein
MFSRRNETPWLCKPSWSLPGNTGEGELLRWSDGVKTKKLMWPPDFIQAHNFSLVDPDILKAERSALWISKRIASSRFIMLPIQTAMHMTWNRSGLGGFGLDYSIDCMNLNVIRLAISFPYPSSPPYSLTCLSRVSPIFQVERGVSQWKCSLFDSPLGSNWIQRLHLNRGFNHHKMVCVVVWTHLNPRIYNLKLQQFHSCWCLL